MAGFSTDVHLCYDLDIWREVLHSHFFAYLDNCKGSIEYRIRWRNVSRPFCFLDGRRGTTSTCTCLFSVFHSCFFWFNNCCVCGRLVSTKVHTRSVIFSKIYASSFFFSPCGNWKVIYECYWYWASLHCGRYLRVCLTSMALIGFLILQLLRL